MTRDITLETNESGSLVLRGDANNDNDASPVAPAAVHGVGFLNVPYVGLPVYWMATAQWLKVFAVVGTFILMCWASTFDRDLQRSKHRANPPARGKDRGGSAHETSDGGLETLGVTGNQTPAMMRTKVRPTGRRSVRLGAAVVASALVLGSVPVAAHAAFTATSRNASNAFTGALSCGATILADGPSSLSQFDADTGSTVVDSVAPGTANATFKGIRTESTPSCVGDGGKSAVFDGITNSITTPTQSIQAPQTFSYEMWFRTTSTLGGKLMSFTVKNPTSADTADDRVLYMLSTGQLRFALTPPYSTADYLTPNVRLNDGNWHHVAVSLSNSGGFQIFVDGKNPNGVLSVKTGPATTGTWVIGTGTSTAWPEGRINNSFQGELDNVAIYNNKPFTLSQAQAHYNAGRVATNRP